MNTTIISLTDMNTNLPCNFQDARLATATTKIVKLYQDAAVYAEQKNRELAKILDQIANGKLYVKDGFTSVADYANQVFGLSRGNAYALSAAGRVYNDAQAPEALKAITPHKLAAVATVDRKTLEKAVSDGTLTAASTEKDFKEFAQKNKPAKDEKPQLVKDYRIRFIGAVPAGINTDDHKPIDKWLAVISVLDIFHGKPDIVKLPNAFEAFPNGTMPKKATLIRRLLISNDFALVVEFKEYHSQVTERTTKVTGPQLTREELLAMLAQLPEAPAAEPTGESETAE